MQIRPAPLPAHLITLGDLVLDDPSADTDRPRRTLGKVIKVTDRRGTLTIEIRTSPASIFTLTTKDYDRPVWVHVPTVEV
jgi:hypothetical protein